MRAALVLLSLAPLASADVRVVSPAGPYTQIQAAVNAANDGDLVLVHAGTYSSFTVQAKSLTVVANTSELVTVTGSASVLDLALGQAVCLIGLHALGPVGQYPQGWALHAAGNLGSVRCDHCVFTAQDWDTDATWIEASSDVSFVGCQMTGGGGIGEFFFGGAGVRALDSSLTFFECSLHGGDGDDSNSSIEPSGNGGQGLHAENCTIFSSHSSFTGGAGGFGLWYGITAPEPGYGGCGAELVPDSQMNYISTTFVGGPNGDFYQTGLSAPAIAGGSFIPIPGTYRSMSVANPARELTSLNFLLHGAAGEGVYLLVGKQTGLQWDPAHEANLLLASPFRTLPVGTTNGSGDLSVSLPLSDLGAGVQSDMFYVQPLFVGPGGAQQLGTPITLAALDQAF